MGCKEFGHDWATELNWIFIESITFSPLPSISPVFLSFFCNAVYFCLFFCLFFGWAACPILVIQPRIEPALHALHRKLSVFTTGLPGKSPFLLKLKYLHFWTGLSKSILLLPSFSTLVLSFLYHVTPRLNFFSTKESCQCHVGGFLLT